MNMKKSVLIAFMLQILCLSLFSCEDDNEVQTAPKMDFTFNYSSFVLNNGDVLTVTTSIVKANSSPGLGISCVEYYWDEELKETIRAEPFVWNYKIEGQPVGKHTVKKVVYTKETSKYKPMKVAFANDVAVVE